MVFITNALPNAFSVSHGYRFYHGVPVTVYTGTGTVYLITAPWKTVPVWAGVTVFGGVVARNPHTFNGALQCEFSQ